MANPTAAALIIGDEILSGRTREANMLHLAQKLAGHGIDLCETRMVRDDSGAIIRAVQSLAAEYDHVFTSGGIGPTHDDITADCIAQAFGRDIGPHPEALVRLKAHYAPLGIALNDARQRMARIPGGAVLIDNPISAAPGFQLENVHVMAGVPTIFAAMLESVLPQLSGGAPLKSETLHVARGEGDIAGPLRDISGRFGDLSFGCYPYMRDGQAGAHIVLRGHDGARLTEALAMLRRALAK